MREKTCQRSGDSICQALVLNTTSHIVVRQDEIKAIAFSSPYCQESSFTVRYTYVLHHGLNKEQTSVWIDHSSIFQLPVNARNDGMLLYLYTANNLQSNSLKLLVFTPCKIELRHARGHTFSLNYITSNLLTWSNSFKKNPIPTFVASGMLG